MKLIKTASGKKQLKISKKEWQDIGKKAGWTKTAGQLTPEQTQAIQLIRSKFPNLKALFVNKVQRDALLLALTEFAADPNRAKQVIMSLDLMTPEQIEEALVNPDANNQTVNPGTQGTPINNVPSQ